MMPSVLATVSATSLALSGGRSSTCTRPPAISTAWSCHSLFQSFSETLGRVRLLAMMYSTWVSMALVGVVEDQADDLRIGRHHLAVVMIRAHDFAVHQMRRRHMDVV